ncbi:type-F conjugative transfer system pilin assembly protein TrbC [Mycetohabitans sp. B2]|uniref:type-F conjugative transfer system pilin assembly protein TrbC n=1 Tax=Mycetohabitans sp. B2 TaxID=2841274 RepID=UPI001F3554F7|nr:type-F conjugative transfer system pilin assembly protein TrbC [Mycetohabitans sp. B2]
MKKVGIGLMLLATFVRASVAQGTPTASEVDQERQRIETQRKQMFDVSNPATLTRKGAMPSVHDIERERQKVERERKSMFDANNPDIQNSANVFPNVPTPERVGIDIEAITRQYERKAEARKMDDLMIFASFTMPRESLKRLVSQANRVGASVVLYGFKNNSFKDTVQAINALDEPAGNVVVNPNAFNKYKIKVVPTIVLAEAATLDSVDNEGSALHDQFAAVAGDVSLDYALDEIGRNLPQFNHVANRYIQQLRGHP